MGEIWRFFAGGARWLHENRAVVLPIEFCVLLLVMWWSIHTRRPRIDKFLAVFGADEPPQTWNTDQAWRKPTGIRLLEEHKATLLAHEEFLRKGREAALSLKRRLASLRVQPPGYLRRTWCELGTRPYAVETVEEARLLCQQLDRLWTGDAHIEIEDRKDALQALKQGLSQATEASAKNRFNERIIEQERELRDLGEAVRRAQERAKVSPHTAKLREAQEIHVNDVHHDMTKAFLGVLSQMEIFRKRAEFRQQVTDDPSFTKDEKERLFARIDELATAADSKTLPARQPKLGAIYKED